MIARAAGSSDLDIWALWAAWGAGMARFMCHDPHNVFDCVPCDVVASVVLLSGAALQQVSRLPLARGRACTDVPTRGNGNECY